MRYVFVILSLLFVTTASGQEVLSGRVVGVTDGDTLTVLDANNRQHEIRLFAIDSPETTCHHRQPSIYNDQCVEHGQPFGKAAKRSLSELTYGRGVKVKLQPGESYGRKIGTVWVDSVDANLQQVARGYAWHYKRYAARGQTDIEFAQYSNTEKMARSQRYGLWADPSSVEPWDYRHSGRQ